MAQPQDTATIHTLIGDDTFHFVNEANLNQLWGDIASQVAQSGIMGEHTSAAGEFTPDPGDGGRTGAGNVSKDFFGGVDVGATGSGDALADGAQGVHATSNAALLGSDLPGTPIEETVGPFTPDPHGAVGYVTLFDDWILV